MICKVAPMNESFLVAAVSDFLDVRHNQICGSDRVTGNSGNMRLSILSQPKL